jgi:hypothetical protein
MEKVHIKARVVRMRKVPAFLNPSESISLEMVLIDVKVSYFYILGHKKISHWIHK